MSHKTTKDTKKRNKPYTPYPPYVALSVQLYRRAARAFLHRCKDLQHTYYGSLRDLIDIVDHMGCVTLSYQEMADLMHFRCIRTPQRQVKHFEEELKFLEVDRRKIGPRQHAKNRYRLTLPLTLPQDTAQPYSIDKVGKPIHCDKRSPEVFRNPQEREKNARAHEEILQTITPEVLTRELLLLQRSLLYIGQPGWIAYDTTLEKIAYLRTMLEAFA